MKPAETSVTPMMIGMSTRWIACQVSCPTPGQPNTLSTTTMPLMKSPMSMPTMAMIGRIAFGSACRNRTRQRVSPLARAVRTKSWPQHVDQRRAHDPPVPARPDQPERQRRQHHVRRRPVAADREPPQPHREDVEEQDARRRTAAPRRRRRRSPSAPGPPAAPRCTAAAMPMRQPDAPAPPRCRPPSAPGSPAAATAMSSETSARCR